jgi:phosphoribosylformylglycinamidine (FGAM) synthase-like enzyme
MIGLIEDISRVTRSTFHQDGDAILLLGAMGGELGGSEYLSTIHGKVVGAPPRCDPTREKLVIDALLEAIASGVVSSAHDCSDGGLAVAIAECCIANREWESGAEIDLSAYSAFSDRASSSARLRDESSSRATPRARAGDGGGRRSSVRADRASTASVACTRYHTTQGSLRSPLWS